MLRTAGRGSILALLRPAEASIERSGIGAVMISGANPATVASADFGVATVTRPAPARNAPRAASRAAPVCDSPPDTTTAWPRAYLWPSTRGMGKVARHNAGTSRNVRGRTCASTSAGMPISATSSRPQWSRPGSSTCPGLRRKKVTVSSASTAAPMAKPLEPLKSAPITLCKEGLHRKKCMLRYLHALRQPPFPARRQAKKTTLNPPSRL